MADKMTGAARAFLGQGLGMGWGDEAEAWLRSRLGSEEYEPALKRIRQEYAEYARQNPGTAMAAEFAGGMAPAVGMMFVPGMQPAATAQAQRSTAGALGRLAALGGASGAVSGAGSATEGERGTGALVGGTLGTALGVGIPVALRTAKGAGQWLRDRLAPSEKYIQSRASQKVSEALKESDMSPQQLDAALARDRAMGVPSTVANVDAAVADLAEAVAQRTGKGTRKVEKTLTQQKAGSRERTYQQVQKGLRPGEYYADEARLVKELRDKADPAYEAVFAHGAVDDPIINQVLKNPTFQEAYRRGQKIAEAKALAAKLRGDPDYEKYLLKDIYEPKYVNDPQSGLPILQGFNLREVPDLRTLDYVKRGLDDIIDAGFRGESSSGKTQAAALKDLRNQFRDRLDQLVPEYQNVRKMYAGDMEVLGAMRSGMDDFNKLDHEQVIKLVANMSQAEKDAFRTGVARHLYGRIMDSAQTRNAASNIINSPETTAKLQPLFDDPAHFRLFKAAMEREAQLFQQASRILGGSQTAKRGAMREALEEGGDIGQTIGQAVTGSPVNALTGLVARLANRATITPAVADKMADMLMAKNPADVAAVVKLLEDYAAQQAPRAVRATAGEAGAVTGGTTSIWNPPPVEEPETTAADIESELEQSRKAPGDELEKEWLLQQTPQR